MQLEDRGMTLIELVVVMLISAIVMGIAGSLLLTSTKHYQTIIASEADQQTLEAITEFMRSELLYASAVEIQETKKTDEKDWNYFYISEPAAGRLYHNTLDHMLYTDSFYHNRHLRLSSHTYENDRMDLFLSLFDETTSVYSTKQTLVLSNIKGQKDDGSEGLQQVSMDNEREGYYIYYQKIAPQEEDAPFSGTVADQLACKSPEGHYPDLGEYKKIADKGSIQQGDFVSIIINGEKHWYRYLLDYPSCTEPQGSDGTWKRVTSPDYLAASNYVRADVVRYVNTSHEERYYAYTQNIPSYKVGTNAISNNLMGVWNPVYPNQYQTAFCEIQESGFSINHLYVYDSPYAKLYENGIIPETASFIKDTDAKMIDPITNETFTASHVVQDASKDLWINIATTPQPSNTIGTKVNGIYVWQKLQVLWDETSAYQKGDIVMVGEDTFQAMEDVFDGTKPKRYQGNQWKLVTYSTQYPTRWVDRNS